MLVTLPPHSTLLNATLLVQNQGCIKQGQRGQWQFAVVA